MNNGAIERNFFPLISVVLPVFNAEKYVTEAVQSILDQTFSNFELILINDGSTDGSLEILKAFKNIDNRVVLISRENKGLVASLNEGVSLARGKWLARMDADDKALPHRFERQLQWLEDSGCDLCGSWVQLFGTSNKRVLRLPITDEAIKIGMLFSCQFAHPTVMIRLELLKKLHYDVSWENAEDYDLWVRAAEAGWKMTNVPQVLLNYRIHTQQISSYASDIQKQLTQKIRRRHWMYFLFSTHLKSNQIDECLKVFEPLSMVNMDTVDELFSLLLQRYEGESRDVIVENATKLYLRVAANCPTIVTRWVRLNRNFKLRVGLISIFILWLFQKLKIQMEGRFFSHLKKYTH